MSDFSSIGPGVNGSGSVGPVNRVTAVSSPLSVNRMTQASVVEVPLPVAAVDRVEVSDRARFLDMLRNLPDVRQDRIDRVKSAINAGDYDTEEVLDAALDQLAREEL